MWVFLKLFQCQRSVIPIFRLHMYVIEHEELFNLLLTVVYRQFSMVVSLMLDYDQLCFNISSLRSDE